ncbi:hypothetical protein J3A83DRAFT_3701019 [Scleroderma citrinum]
MLAGPSLETDVSRLPVVPFLSRSSKLSLAIPSVSSFYQNVGVGTSTRRPSAKYFPSFDGGPDPLAVIRPPPPWSTLESYEKPFVTNTTTPKQRPVFGSRSDLSQFAPRRFNKRTAGVVNDMVNMLANKRQKCESAPPRVLSGMSGTSRNPFAKRTTSAFSESQDDVSKLPGPQLDHVGSSSGANDLPNEVGSIKVPKLEPNLKPLKPITSLKVPVLPKEYLPCPPKVPPHTVKPKVALKQARLSFPPA